MAIACPIDLDTHAFDWMAGRSVRSIEFSEPFHWVIALSGAGSIVTDTLWRVLDGARLVALVLPPDARRVYRDADRYLPLFVLVLWFLLAGVMKSLVYGLVDSLCGVFAGFVVFRTTRDRNASLLMLPTVQTWVSPGLMATVGLIWPLTA